ncbi:type II toxin-antitoxin system VapB family antitoxin [Fibrella arboris]|uniref:type II toxin-antitoxin system VapB family antitoxin n=1 Tax=Fibrella arboris TaxID=3242486 RepID=UPI0035229D85
MSVLEQIDSKASQLPPELQAEVLDFIEFLEVKKRKNQPVKDVSFPELPNKRGAGKGIITFIADDFNAPLDDLNDYMH